MRVAILFVVCAAIAAIPAQAEVVYVEATGFVEYNQVNFGIFADVNSGDPVTLYFEVDSDVFLNSSYYPTRGYAIDLASYSLTMGSVSVGLQDPYPAGHTPYFVLRDNDPAVDGFFMADNNVDWPWPPVPLNEWGRLDIFRNIYEVGYTGDTLSSLDIIDAEGFYDYTGLTRYYFVVMDGWAEPIGLWWQTMTISRIPVDVPVDIKPGSCPNPFNVNSHGDLPVAILGTPDLDGSMIDPASVRLAGVAPLRSDYEDVGTPFEPYTGREDCDLDCNEMESDGFMDLTFKFDTQEVAAALGGVEARGCLAISLTGNFWPEYGGGPIAGEDVVRTLRPASQRQVTDRVMQQVERPSDLANQPIRRRN
jgi:hypothetical protein